MKVNLKNDMARLRRYFKQRIRDYPVFENLGPGEDDDPIRLITVGFYATQGGYVNLVFDTRLDADTDGEWTGHIDNETNTCSFPKWKAACNSISAGKSVSITLDNGTKSGLTKSVKDELKLQRHFGGHLVELMRKLRDDGSLQELPLAPKAFMVVEEFDGCFYWPDHKNRKSDGRII